MSQQPTALEQFGRFFDGQKAYFAESEASLAARAQRESGQRHYLFCPALGEGWIDLHQFGSGIMVGRMHGQLARPLDARYQAFPDNVMLGIIVNGQARTLRQSNRLQAGGEGDVFLRHADPGPISSHIPAGHTQSSISIDVPREMLETLREQGVDISFLGRRNTYAVLQPNGQAGEAIRQLGRRMLAVQTRNHLLGRLELESLSLDLLVQLLSAGGTARTVHGAGGARRWRSAVDEVVDILHAEWNQPQTIAALARRAGINECYLKTMFRERTGSTIAGYLRDLRMWHAREMVETGRKNLLQIANECGYARADKFSEAFRRVHGTSPRHFR